MMVYFLAISLGLMMFGSAVLSLVKAYYIHKINK